ncbi:hypothetical protein [Lysinibacillus sp. NPDC056232]|uniref:hypothetical protein n=1 Tax=Lysinibacillus sp. NPDC056232 TaxID=3345756 RepID=UPI0035D6ABAC
MLSFMLCVANVAPYVSQTHHTRTIIENVAPKIRNGHEPKLLSAEMNGGKKDN